MRLALALSLALAACGSDDGTARGDAPSATGDGSNQGTTDGAASPDAGPPPTIDTQLCAAINNRRADASLPAIPLSSSIMLVARYHVEDLDEHGTGGGSCNLHSWSTGDPRWTGCCYTADHAQAQCMWDKPNEIDNHDSNGYEIASSAGTVAGAMAGWEGSQAHRDVILNQGIWANLTWRSLGCAIEGSYSVVWFSELADP